MDGPGPLRAINPEAMRKWTTAVGLPEERNRMGRSSFFQKVQSSVQGTTINNLIETRSLLENT